MKKKILTLIHLFLFLDIAFIFDSLFWLLLERVINISSKNLFLNIVTYRSCSILAISFTVLIFTLICRKRTRFYVSMSVVYMCLDVGSIYLKTGLLPINNATLIALMINMCCILLTSIIIYWLSKYGYKQFAPIRNTVFSKQCRILELKKIAYAIIVISIPVQIFVYVDSIVKVRVYNIAETMQEISYAIFEYKEKHGEFPNSIQQIRNNIKHEITNTILYHPNVENSCTEGLQILLESKYLYYKILVFDDNSFLILPFPKITQKLVDDFYFYED